MHLKQNILIIFYGKTNGRITNCILSLTGLGNTIQRRHYDHNCLVFIARHCTELKVIQCDAIRLKF